MNSADNTSKNKLLTEVIMSIISSASISGILSSGTQALMRNAVAAYNMKSSELPVSSASNDSMIAAMSGIAGIDMQGLAGGVDLTGMIMNVRSAVASMAFPDFLTGGADDFFPSGLAGAMTESMSTSGYFESGYENITASGITMMLENPTAALLAQLNASAENVLGIFG